MILSFYFQNSFPLRLRYKFLKFQCKKIKKNPRFRTFIEIHMIIVHLQSLHMCNTEIFKGLDILEIMV